MSERDPVAHGDEFDIIGFDSDAARFRDHAAAFFSRTERRLGAILSVPEFSTPAVTADLQAAFPGQLYRRAVARVIALGGGSEKAA